MNQKCFLPYIIKKNCLNFKLFYTLEIISFMHIYVNITFFVAYFLYVKKNTETHLKFYIPGLYNKTIMYFMYVSIMYVNYYVTMYVKFL